MQIFQKKSHFSHLDCKEENECKTSYFVNEKLESITKIALIAIPVFLVSFHVYSKMKNFIHKISRIEPISSSNNLQRIKRLQSIGIDLEEDVNDPYIFRSVNCSFIQLHEAMKKLPEEMKESLGIFYYCPEKRAICYDDSGCYCIQYPEEHQWETLIKGSKNQREEEHPPLRLTNGSLYSQEAFTKHPLFQNTLERYTVFQNLYKLHAKTSFQHSYAGFLEMIQSNDEHWAERYRHNPIELSYLSLFAYLDAKITQEELFIVHMLACAFLESPETASYTVLSPNNIRAYLKKYSFLSEENAYKDFYSLRNLEKKSIILKTAISFQSGQPRERAAYTTLTKRGGKNPPGVILLSSSEKKPPVDLALLPPWLWKRLYAELNPLQSPPIEHEEFFGFRRRLDDLTLGRPISYASPLFYLPAVHGLKGTQLGVTVHDILFHSYLDWLHPDAHNFIKLGQKVRTLGNEKEAMELAMHVLDRAMINLSSDRDTNILYWLREHSYLIRKLSIENQEKFFAFALEIFGEKIMDSFHSREGSKDEVSL